MRKLKLSFQEMVDLVEYEEAFIENHRLMEMAFPLSKVQDILINTNFLFRRLEHLMLVFYFRDKPVANHWKKEIVNFVPPSFLVKRKNKRLPRQEIFHYLWKCIEEDGPTELYRNTLARAKFKENSLPWGSIEDPSSCLAFMEGFHDWASRVLSKNEEVDPDETIETIDSLLKRYPLKT